MIRLAILASGSGTNAENIIKYFQKSTLINVELVLSNKPNAKVLQRAKKFGVDSISFDRDEFFYSENILLTLKDNADFIVLAGFLWKVPSNIIDAFSNKIVNIHPALLPKYGGKGMYGMHVHNAVVNSREHESGITIHYVNDKYDEGAIIFQKSFKVLPTDTAEDVASKVHILEYAHFPEVIENVILQNG